MEGRLEDAAPSLGIAIVSQIAREEGVTELAVRNREFLAVRRKKCRDLFEILLSRTLLRRQRHIHGKIGGKRLEFFRLKLGRVWLEHRYPFSLLPPNAPADQFAEAVCWFASRNSSERRNLREAARRTSNLFTREKATRRVLDLYRSLVPRPMTRSVDTSPWMTTVRRLEQEWRILRNVAHAVGDAVLTREPAEGNPVAGASIDGCFAVSELHLLPSGVTAGRLSRGLLTNLTSRVCEVLLRTWCASWRKNVSQLDRLDQLLAGNERVLVAFWHGEYFPLFALAEGRTVTVLAAPSFRGEVIAKLCRRFGYEAAMIPVQEAASQRIPYDHCCRQRRQSRSQPTARSVLFIK